MTDHIEPESPRPPRLTRSSALELLRQHEQSNLSIAAFAAQHGLAAQTLYRWRNLLKGPGDHQPAGPLINVTASMTAVAPLCPVLVLPSGVRLEHPELLSADQLRAVCSAC